MPMSVIVDLIIGAVGAIAGASVTLGMLLIAYVDETPLEPKDRLAPPLLTVGAVLGVIFLVIRWSLVVGL